MGYIPRIPRTARGMATWSGRVGLVGRGQALHDGGARGVNYFISVVFIVPKTTIMGLRGDDGEGD